MNPPWFVRFQDRNVTCDVRALTTGRVELAATHAAKALEMAEQSEDPEWIAEAGGIAAIGSLGSR